MTENEKIVSDWHLFIELAKRMGANISYNGSTQAAMLGNTHMAFDHNEHRAYVTLLDNNSCRWLDNNVIVWIDTLQNKSKSILSIEQQRQVVDLLKLVVTTHPDIVYGREIQISLTDVVNWLIDWVPEVQNFLDDVDG